MIFPFAIRGFILGDQCRAALMLLLCLSVGDAFAQQGARPTMALGLAPISVAASLAAKGAVTQPGAETVVFDGPGGDGRRGAKGILLKGAAEATARAGSSWSFVYKRAGSASVLQIIHPIGRGQAVVHVKADGIGISTPEQWWLLGYGDGDPKEDKPVRQTQAFKKVFPLKDGTEYAIVSRLSASGAYELFVNGQQVATGRATITAKPLDLEIPNGAAVPSGGRDKLEFKGADGAVLPMKWSPGWSGVLVGPLDGGEHVCRDLKFYAGLASGEGEKK
jgi:hypothetical protein